MTPEGRLGTYYAAAFGAIGLITPFLSVWLDARGLSAAMIGAVVAAPSIAMVLTTVLAGRWIDSLAEPRTGIVVLNVLALLLNAGLVATHAAWGILVLWTLVGVLMHAMAPACDALALAVTARRGTDWARLRMCGSLGFVLTVVTGGALYERLGIEIFVVTLLGASLMRTLAALNLPSVVSPFPAAPANPAAPAASPPSLAPPPVRPPAPSTGGATDAPAASPPAATPRSRPAPTADDALHRSGVLLVLGGAALINASHAFFYGFGLLVWTRAGIGETLGSLLWSAGVVAEIALMWRFGAIARRVSARGCLGLAGCAGLLRWSLAALEPAVGWLLFAQTLHALTFGLTFLATASFIARRVAPREATRGQSLAATFSAAAMAGASWGAGLLYERVGSAASYAAMGLLCLVGIALVGASYLGAPGRGGVTGRGSGGSGVTRGTGRKA